MLHFTPSERLNDPEGRPYFLWDCDLTLSEFETRLRVSDPEARAYLIGKLMRQAKPDDVFLFVRPRVIRELWPRLTRYLGRTRDFWTWLFDTWERQGRSSPALGQLRVGGQEQVCTVDLVAEPLGSVELAVQVEVGVSPSWRVLPRGETR